MQPRDRRRITAVLAVVVAAGVLAVAFYLEVSRPPAPLQGALEVLDRGNLTQPNHLTIPFVNLSLTFSSPSWIDPARLVLTVVCSPGCYSPFAENSTGLAPTVELRYAANSFPHWLATSDGSTWTGFTATVENPDHRVVGGTVDATANVATSIESGAILTVTLPTPGVNPEPVQSLVLTYEGHAGSVHVPLA